MKTILLFIFLPLALSAQIPVTDVANLANNQVAQAANLAKWVESINNLRTQIDQLNRQINIQDDIRHWTGNPGSTSVVLDGLGASELVREYGRSRATVLGSVDSLDSLKGTAAGTYRPIAGTDLDGGELQRDPLAYRRYSVLDATQANAEQVAVETKTRETELQEEIARTLEDLRAAPTDAETQKLAAKLAALNGQLAQVEASRKREVDTVTLQKIANDARLEQERQAAAELAAKDDFLANRRVSAYMQKIKVRQNENR